mmetsp:Transcript_10971/g.29434  ORF Transcript_10971/g.29434 Transcript_10971/m.29434 type:complete len:165 (+) Transcript_10971:644-1138(+)
MIHARVHASCCIYCGSAVNSATLGTWLGWPCRPPPIKSQCGKLASARRPGGATLPPRHSQFSTLPLHSIIMSGMQGTKRATEYDPSSTSASSSSSRCRALHGSGSGGGACGARGDGGGDGGGGLYELPHDPVRMVFDFLDGPADILRVATLRISPTGTFRTCAI